MRIGILVVLAIVATALVSYNIATHHESNRYTKYLNDMLSSYEESTLLYEDLLAAKEAIIQVRGERIDTLTNTIETLTKLLEATRNTPVKTSAPPGLSVDKFTLSAYSPYDDVNGINSSGSPASTYTGTVPRPGTFAVDPKVVPLGSSVMVLYNDGTIERGIAEDIGGAIKGNRLDVFRQSYKEAIKFGKQGALVIWW